MPKKLEPIAPSEILLSEFLEPMEISQNKLARDLDVPGSRISGIVKGGRSNTADTALRLAAYFGTSAEMWLRLQCEFDLRVTRQTTWPDIAPRIRKFDAA